MAPESPLLTELKDKFAASWLRGAAWRLEQGELLSQIKEECDHGQWGEFLKEYDIPRSTADDYIRRYKDEVQITVPRQFNEAEPDPEAEERKQQIEEEKKKREGKKPTHHATQLHVRIKGLTADQLAAYRTERKENPEHVKDIWMRAFLSVIGEEWRGLPEPEEEREREDKDDLTTDEATALCPESSATGAAADNTSRDALGVPKLQGEHNLPASTEGGASCSA